MKIYLFITSLFSSYVLYTVFTFVLVDCVVYKGLATGKIKMFFLGVDKKASFYFPFIPVPLRLMGSLYIVYVYVIAVWSFWSGVLHGAASFVIINGTLVWFLMSFIFHRLGYMLGIVIIPYFILFGFRVYQYEMIVKGMIKVLEGIHPETSEFIQTLLDDVSRGYNSICRPLQSSHYVNEVEAEIQVVEIPFVDVFTQETPVRQIVVTSQLNGNNGEVTNTDDLPAKTTFGKIRGKQDEKVEMETYQPRTNGNKNEVCKHFLQGKCNKKNCKYIHPQNLNVVVEQQVVKVQVLWLVYGKCFDGRNFLEYPHDDSKMVIRCDDHVNVEEEKGVYYYNENGKRSGDFFQIVTYPSFSYGTVSYGIQRDVFVSLSVLNFLKTEFGIVSKESRNQNAVVHTIFKKHPCAPLEIVKYTMEYFLYLASMLRIGGEIEYKETEKIAIRHQLDNYTNGKVCLVPAVREVKDPDWKFNGNFYVVKQEDFIFKAKKGEIPEEYPSFKTGVSPKPRQYMRMAAFAPVGGFDFIDPCGLTMGSGMARLFACREGELEKPQNIGDDDPPELLNDDENDEEGPGVYTFDDELVSNQTKVFTGIKTEILQEFLDLTQASILTKGGKRYIVSKFHFKNGKEIPRRWVEIKEDQRFIPFRKALVDRFSSPWFLLMALFMMFLTYVGGVYSYLFSVLNPNFKHVEHVVKIEASLEPPHVKKDTYMRWFLDQMIYYKILGNVVMWSGNVKWEIAKTNSYARLYGSAEHACLVDRLGPELGKKLFSFPFHLHEIKPKDIIGEFPNTEMIYKETDIKKCDMSNLFVIFLAWVCLTNLIGKTLANFLIGQLALSVKCTNPSQDTEFAILAPMFFFMYSGSCLTTFINNIASYVIFVYIYLEVEQIRKMEIQFHDCQEVSKRDRFWNQIFSVRHSYAAFFSDDGALKVPLGVTNEQIEKAANKIGYQLTVTDCNNTNKVPFLKSAYNGEFSYILLGTLLRSFGVVDKWEGKSFGLKNKDFGDYTDVQLFEIYGKNRIQGLVNEPGNRILNALRRRFSLGVPENYVDDLHLCDRYSIDYADLIVLETAILNMRLGDVISNRATQRIFHVDYGTPPPVVQE